MAFLTLNIEKCSLMMEKTQLEYQQMVYQNEYDDAQEQIVNYTNGDDADSESTEMKRLEAIEEYYDNQKGAVESRLTLLNQEIESYDKIVGENIKNTCKLTYST